MDKIQSYTWGHNLKVGCPQNNPIFFSVRTETNRNSICFGCFSVCFAKPKNIFFDLFRFVLVCWTGIETTETNRTLSKQTGTKQNKPKDLQKTFSIRRSTKQLIFFLGLNRNSIFSVVFWFVFLRNQKKFVFGLFQFFGPV